MILAMSVGTPVVGYFDQRWGSKNPGTLGQFEMPYGYIGEVNDLVSLLQVSISNKEAMNKEVLRLKDETVTHLINNI